MLDMPLNSHGDFSDSVRGVEFTDTLFHVGDFILRGGSMRGDHVCSYGALVHVKLTI